MSKTRFKVWCDKKKKHFYWCYIFNTRDGMHKWNESNGCEYKDGYEAITRKYRREHKKNGRWVLFDPKEIGSVSFYAGNIGAGIASHEFTHAALYWFKHRYKDLQLLDKTKHDEIFAWTSGYLVFQFWTRFNKLEDEGRIKKVKK